MEKNAIIQMKLGSISLLSGVLFLLGSFATSPILAVKPLSKTEFFGLGHGQSSINTGKPNRQFLIAASPQLDNFLYNLTYRVTSIARYYISQRTTTKLTMLHGQSSTKLQIQILLEILRGVLQPVGYILEIYGAEGHLTCDSMVRLHQ